MSVRLRKRIEGGGYCILRTTLLLRHRGRRGWSTAAACQLEAAFGFWVAEAELLVVVVA
jgi:hypothetical protein